MSVITTSLPETFLQRLSGWVDAADWPRVVASYAIEKSVGLRVNGGAAAIKACADTLVAAGIDYLPCPINPAGMILPARHRDWLVRCVEVSSGEWYVQAPSSWLPPLVLDPQPGDSVLDLAAAPGSKTSQMADQMRGEGYLAAVEKVRSRFFRLRDNLARQRMDWVRLFLKDGSTVWRSCPNRFDKILLDAPCSSNGRFHLSQPKTLEFWQPRKSREMQRAQWKLLQSAGRSLAPGGTLVYATCSLDPAENEAVVSKCLRYFAGEIELQPIKLSIAAARSGLVSWPGGSGPVELANCCRIIPDNIWDGFFMAKFRKKL